MRYSISPGNLYELAYEYGKDTPQRRAQKVDAVVGINFTWLY